MYKNFIIEYGITITSSLEILNRNGRIGAILHMIANVLFLVRFYLLKMGCYPETFINQFVSFLVLMFIIYIYIYIYTHTHSTVINVTVSYLLFISIFNEVC